MNDWCLSVAHRTFGGFLVKAEVLGLLLITFEYFVLFARLVKLCPFTEIISRLRIDHPLPGP